MPPPPLVLDNSGFQKAITAVGQMAAQLGANAAAAAAQAAAIAAAPPLLSRETTAGGDTLYLDIDVGNQVGGGTAVFIPGPAAVSAGTVNVFLWFHGHKGMLGKLNLSKFTVSQYLQVTQFQLREMVQKASRHNFVLVVPPLDDSSKADKWFSATGAAAGAGAFTDTFIDQVMAGILAYGKGGLGGKPSLGNLVLGSHSGGYACMWTVANTASATVSPKIREVWMVDSTYGGTGQKFANWVKSGHSGVRLWVYASAPSAGTIPDALGTIAVANAASPKLTTVEVSTLGSADGARPRVFLNWDAAISKTGPEHNASVGAFVPQLIGRCPHF